MSLVCKNVSKKLFMYFMQNCSEIKAYLYARCHFKSFGVLRTGQIGLHVQEKFSAKLDFLETTPAPQRCNRAPQRSRLLKLWPRGQRRSAVSRRRSARPLFQKIKVLEIFLMTFNDDKYYVNIFLTIIGCLKLLCDKLF